VDIECGDAEDDVNDLIIASDMKQEVDSREEKNKNSSEEKPLSNNILGSVTLITHH